MLGLTRFTPRSPVCRAVVRIASIEPGSIAEELELRIGTRIVRINGEPVRDGIDLSFLLSESDLEIEVVDPDGLATVFEVDRDPGEALGIVPAPDTIRECANECVFCFIDGNPKGVRPSLWLRDDDFRLSFTYGSYVTLTNLGPKGFQRLIDQRISPLYVSVHATEPDVRIRLLKNDRAGLIVDQLTAFANAGLEVHTQIVLCPEWNDGAHLDRTLNDLWQLGEAILSVSVVPVGLTRLNVGKPVRPLTAAEADDAITQVDRARARALEHRGRGWAYSADELYLLADRAVPPESYYDERVLTENGVGSVRALLDAFDDGVGTLPRSEERLLILTGESMAPFITPLGARIADTTGGTCTVRGVENRFYGRPTTVAGLLAGRDLIDAVPDADQFDRILMPADALNQDNVFIDSVPFAEVQEAFSPARVQAGHELIALVGAS